MSGFKDPYDPNIKLSSGCGCGRHSTRTEHDAANETDLLASGGEALHARVVESAVMRALFPQDELRRRFLRAVGAGTALSAISTFFPLGVAKEAFAQTGKLEKPSVKIGFIPITCATPIIMSVPMGFYSRAGSQRGRRKNRRLGGDPRQDAEQGIRRLAHALADAAGDHRWALGSPSRFRIPCRQSRTSTARPSRCRSSTRTSAIRSSGRASSSRCPSTTRCTTTCCATTWPSMASIRTRTSRSASVPPPEMVANLRADNIDGFLAPDPVNQRAVYDGVGFIHTLTQGSVGRPSVLRVRREQGIHHHHAEHLSRVAPGHRGRHRICAPSRKTASRSRKRSRRPISSISR